jgi:tetratricopeptide (TPR) repeat protein
MREEEQSLMPNGKPDPAPPFQERAKREVRRAERLAERGQVGAAIESLQLAIQFGADRYTCYLRLARLYQTRKQWTEAVFAAEKAIAERPEHLSAREAIIALHLESRNYEQAIRASKALLKISPHHVPARDALGAAYIGLGDVQAAMRVANELIRLAPNNPTHHFTKALLCQHCKDVRLAVAEFEQVIALAPESEMADNAREHLDALDSFQLDHISLLATEDAVFRAKLVRETEMAAMERGFYLSEEGWQILQQMAMEQFAETDLPCKPTLYH